jgi:hypothetical protein
MNFSRFSWVFVRIGRGYKEIKADDSSLEQIYLKLSGLINEKNKKLSYTNKIYEKLFNQFWLDESLSKIDRPFAKDLQRWIELNKTDSALLTGEVLNKALEWASSNDDLTVNESEYLRISSQYEQEYILKEARKQEQSKTIKYLTLFSFLLIFVGIGLVYFYLESKKQEIIAIKQKNIALEQKDTVEK